MGEQSEKRISFENLTTSVVFEYLKSKKVVDNLYKDVLAQIKDTSSYKRLKEVAVMHMTEILNDPSKAIHCPEDRVEKKKQIADIGVLALSIDSTMSQIVSENLGDRAGGLINDALKELLSSGINPQAKMAAEPLKRTNITSQKRNSRTIPKYKKDNKSTNSILECDDESNASNDSCSVSSVHTSDLSSFDDEIELSEKEDGMTVQKKVPLKYVNEIVLNNKFSNMSEEEETSQQAEIPCSKKSKSVSPDNSRKMMPKRIRKPNSKYSSKDMLLLDDIHTRQKELLDVQRDLNIINGMNTKLNKGQSHKSPINRKRKADLSTEYDVQHKK